MVDGTVLSEVDLLTSEHVIAKLLEASLFCELNKKLQCLLSDEVLGKVEQDLGVLGIVLESTAELLESLQFVSNVLDLVIQTYLRILLKVLLQDNVLAKLLVVVLKRGPGIEV